MENLDEYYKECEQGCKGKRRFHVNYTYSGYCPQTYMELKDHMSNLLLFPIYF